MKKELLKKIVPGLGVIIFVIVVGLLLQVNISDQNNDVALANVTVYASPTCGCCTNYIKYLRNNNYIVDVVKTDEVDDIKDQNNIPEDMRSCHTMIMDDYFVEGHIPLEAVDKLLLERPDIDGIALPAMPSGSPGMPGTKNEEFHIYAVSNGIASNFVSI